MNVNTATIKDWKIVTLGDYCKIYQPKTITSKEIKKEGPYKVYGANGVIGFFDKYNHEDSEVLVTCRGATCGRVNFSEPKSWITGNAMVVHPFDNETIDKEFLFFKLLGSRLEILNTGSAQPQITRGPLSNFKIEIPPKFEQQTIATILSKIQEAIENQDKIIKTTTELKKSLMKKIFSEGLNSEQLKQTEIGKIPKSWEVVELNAVCEKPQYGFTASASKKGNVRFLRITDITDDGVDWNTVPFCECSKPSKYLLKDGDIVFARIGATTGKSYLLHNPDNAIFASYLIRVRAKDIRSDYLYVFFQTEAYWNQINAHKKNQLKGGVNGSILSRLLVPKCSDKEQAEIAETFRAIDEKISFAKRKRNVLTDLFKSMLNNLMSGKIRVHPVR